MLPTNKKVKEFVNRRAVSYTGDIMTVVGAGETFLGKRFVGNTTKIGVFVLAGKYLVSNIASREEKYLESLAKGKIMNNLKCVHRVKFKWTNPNKFQYKIVVETLFKYNNKEVGNKASMEYIGSM